MLYSFSVQPPQTKMKKGLQGRKKNVVNPLQKRRNSLQPNVGGEGGALPPRALNDYIHLLTLYIPSASEPLRWQGVRQLY